MSTAEQFAERRLPTVAELNAAAPDTPVSVLHLDQTTIMNGSAVRAAGITPDTPDPTGGQFVRDRTGAPTDVLLAAPSALILYSALAKAPTLSAEERGGSTRHFLRELNRFGLTTAIDAAGGFQRFPDDYATVAELAREGQLTLRIAYHLFPRRAGQELDDLRRWIGMVRAGDGDEWLRRNGAGENLTWSAAGFENFAEPHPELVSGYEVELGQAIRLLMEHGRDSGYTSPMRKPSAATSRYSRRSPPKDFPRYHGIGRSGLRTPEKESLMNMSLVMAAMPPLLPNPTDTVMAFTDYQSQMFFGAGSADRGAIINANIGLAKAARAFNVPVVLATVTADTFSGPILPEPRQVFPDHELIDRTIVSHGRTSSSLGRSSQPAARSSSSPGCGRRSAREAHPVCIASTLAVFPTFTLLGLFSSLTPACQRDVSHQQSSLVAGAATFILFEQGVLAHLFARGRAARTAPLAALPLLIVSLTAVVIGLANSQAVAFAAGLVFMGGLEALRATVQPDYHAAAVTTYFTAVQAGLAIPVLVIGALSGPLGTVAATATVITLTGLIAVVALARTMNRLPMSPRSQN